jgi:CheY-like chemotaxis protein
MELLLAGKRIFVIEDNPNNLLIVKTLLEQQGAIVSFDRFGDETFKRMSEFSPVDLILLDLMFPNHVTGYNLYDLIRQLPGFATVPIVAVSASDPSEAIRRTRQKGFNGFIPKPLNFDGFPRQIAKVLQSGEVWISGGIF